MENLRKYKKEIAIGLFLIFIIGIASCIYFANEKSKMKGFNGYNFAKNDVQSQIVKEEQNKEKVEKEENQEQDQGEREKIDTESNDKSSEGKVQICIHIIGEVRNQGIIIINEGDRIADAIEKAGGVTEKADLNKINLAYILADGQKVRIPSIDENETDEPYVTGGSGNGIMSNENVNGSVKKKININSATQTELESLNGIGPSIAAKIIEYRTKNGKFSSIEDLLNVSGVGESKLDGIRESIVLR